MKGMNRCKKFIGKISLTISFSIIIFIINLITTIIAGGLVYFVVYVGIVNDKNIPINKATTGSPMNAKMFLKVPFPKGSVGKSDTDLSTIKIKGRITGIKDLKAEGAFLTFSTILFSSSFGQGSI